MKPKLITFEGGEGVGKSTQINLLKQSFTNSGIPVKTTREPGGTEGAEKIRELLVQGGANKWDGQTELLLHMAARLDHINRFIKPALTEGNFVICDRFMDSTIAYQAYGHKLGEQYVKQLSTLIFGNFTPDLTIIFDLDIKAAMQRADKRNSKENRYEKMGEAFHNNVRKGFLQIAKDNPYRCVVIDASLGQEEISVQIIKIIEQKFGINLKK